MKEKMSSWIKDMDSNHILTKNLQMHFLELPRVKPELNKKPDTRLDKWLWLVVTTLLLAYASKVIS